MALSLLFILKSTGQPARVDKRLPHYTIFKYRKSFVGLNSVYQLMPCTTIILVFADLCLMSFATEYSGDAHHSFALFTDGNSNTTNRCGFQSPSKHSVFAPRTINFPS